MDNSCCIDEGTSIIDSVSLSPITTENNSPMQLCRMGSGTSVVVDSESGGGAEEESRKLPSSQYKGVVPQPNGRWGAQIYEKHQRVWLGTFNEEEEAAKAYDIAVQRFRGRDAVTNFKINVVEEDDMESIFLNSRSKDEIVDMLRKHTYSDELEHSKRNYSTSSSVSKNVAGAGRYLDSGLGSGFIDPVLSMKARSHLFEKAVTPSDVGKLNRLVIPKQQAEKYFPLQIGTISKGVLLNFEDNEGKVWRFRYSYWNSSQSYVLTKGWSRFVKEKNLKAGYVVRFERSTGQDQQLYIDWKPRINNTTPVPAEINTGTIAQEVVLGGAAVESGQQVVRLFGVNINLKMPVVIMNGSNHSCKRRRENDIQVDKSLSSSAADQYHCKKQFVVL